MRKRLFMVMISAALVFGICGCREKEKDTTTAVMQTEDTETSEPATVDYSNLTFDPNGFARSGMETSIGYVEEYSYCYQGFYVENKTNHPFQLSIGTCDYDDFGGYVFLEAEAEACPVIGISETDAFKSADTMEVMFHLYSGLSAPLFVIA